MRLPLWSTLEGIFPLLPLYNLPLRLVFLPPAARIRSPPIYILARSGVLLIVVPLSVLP